jgi:hypothetical protein
MKFQGRMSENAVRASGFPVRGPVARPEAVLAMAGE